MKKSKFRILVFIGFVVVVTGNIICYNINGRLLHTSTNLVVTTLIIANLYRNYQNVN